MWNDKVYSDAIAMLSNTNSASARIGGIYSLTDIAANNTEQRGGICDILCARVREATQQSEYQATYKDQPSNEIRSLLDVLTKRNIFVNERLDFFQAYLCGAYLDKSDLSDAVLAGVNLSRAHLSNVNLDRAIITGINLHEAHLVDINLSKAKSKQADRNLSYALDVKLGRANRKRINLSGASLLSVDITGMNLEEVDIVGVYLSFTEIMSANLKGSNLSGAIPLAVINLSNKELTGIKLNGTDLSDVNLSGANLSEANLQGSNLHTTNLQGVNLHNAQLHGAYCDSQERNISFHERINSRRGKGTDLSGAKNVPTNINEIADTGILTDEMADEIIQEYDEAMGEK